MAFSLKKVVMDELKRKRMRSLVDKSTLWPSQAAVLTRTGQVVGKCLRASYYEKTGEAETNPVSDEVTAMGYMGTKIEDGLIDLLKNQGIWENNNVKWQRYNISGEVDVLIRILNTENVIPVEELWTVECKSCSGYYANKELYGYYEGTGSNRAWVPGKPKDKHYLQACLYTYAGREKCKGTILFYISRDESRMTEFFITTDDDGNIFLNGVLEQRFKIQDILDRYDLLQRAIDTQDLPDRDYKPEYSDAEVEYLYASKDISKAARDNHMSRKNLYADSDCTYCNFKLKCLDQQIQPKQNDSFAVIDLFATSAAPSSSAKPDYIAYGSF
jgi:hypothetical protein